MERRYWWWNGSWGRMVRRDILVHEHQGRWAVEARAGGVEGHSRWAEVPTETAAVELAERAMVGPVEWHDMMPVVRAGQEQAAARRAELEAGRTATNADDS